MKRFIVIAAIFSVLAFWALFHTLLTVSSRDEMLPVATVPVMVAPVFDTTGAVVSDPTGTLLNANHPIDMVIPVTGAAVMIAPVFDVTGAVVSDPTGTLLNANHARDMVVPVQVAPVYDATGALVSDPTGTVSNATNP